MTAGLRGARPRVAVDANVLMEAESLRRVLLAADLGLLQPIWSPQVVCEVARAGSWRLGRRCPAQRPITARQFEDYLDRLSERIDAIDLRFELVRSTAAVPIGEEVAWADSGDPGGLHLQLLARTAQADCVVSWNHRDFPARQVVDGRPCGEHRGVLWITPDQVPSLRLPAVEVMP